MVILSEFLPEKHEIVKELQLQKGLVTLGYRDNRCSHTVKFPISPPEYRKTNPTQASFNVKESSDEIVIDFTTDYGRRYTLTITGDQMKNPIVRREIGIIKKEEIKDD